MAGYLVCSEARHAYLERNGYDGTYGWLAAIATPQYATVFTKAMADQVAAQCPAEARVSVVPDPLRREPVVDVEPKAGAA